MTNYIKRLVYIDASEKIKINPLFWPFIFAIFVYGVGFIFGGTWTGVSSSSLYQSFYSMHHTLPFIWGLTAASAGALAFILALTRKAQIGDFAAMFGFLVWFFAFITYAMNGYWLVALTVSGPNLYFWVFYFLRLSWYKRQKAAGLLVDAG